MRNLVSIKFADSVNPHPNADRLELVTVGGWTCVAPIGMFKAGDELLYFEIDSVLPVHPLFEHLRKSCYVKKDWIEGFRLKTIRLRGILSQGLVQPISLLERLGVDRNSDLTESIGVVKWDPPMPARISGLMAGRFPSNVPKTDQERIQNIDLRSHRGIYEVTEKLDGTSMTIIVGPESPIRVCSRNYELRETEDSTLWQVARELFTSFTPDREYAFQGELIGPGIQGNSYKAHRPEFQLFDIYDVGSARYLTSVERIQVARELNIPHTPVIDARFEVAEQSVNDILKMADGESVIGPCGREGLVFKSLCGSRSFKAISNTWLEDSGH